MSFPVELLPNANRKLIDCDLSGHYLLRYTQSNNVAELTNPITDGVTESSVCSPREHVADLSTSLHGTFATSHCAIDLTEQGKAIYNYYCPPDEVVPIPRDHQDFILSKERGWWSLLISRISGIAVEYRRDEKTMKAVCAVVHTPMKWNFWHFSLRWKLEDGNMLHELAEPERRKIAKKVGHEARAVIAMYARFVEPPTVTLPSSCYSKVSD